MGWDGSGNFSRTLDWTDDASAGTKIKSDRHDTNDDELAAGISNCLTKDGQSQPTADIPMNGKRLTNVGAPTDALDAVNKKYVDEFTTYAKGIDITGADANGQIKFSSTSGVQGFQWVGADMSWLARPGVAGPPVTKNRLVLNDKADGTGTDVIEMREDGTALLGPVVEAKGTSAMFKITPTSGNGHIYWYDAAGTAVRMILYASGGAQGPGVLQLGNGKNWQFAVDGSFQNGGGMQFQYNANLYGVGSIWANWGANDAFNAISARIEARAQAWAVAQMNNTVTSMRAAGIIEDTRTSGQTGQWREFSGYVCTGYNRIAGDQYAFRFRQPQMYIPSQGWLLALSGY